MFQYAPTNKLLYAKDIPKFKQEVKVYYKQVREQSPVTASEFKNFLLEESKVTLGTIQKSKHIYSRRSLYEVHLTSTRLDPLFGFRIALILCGIDSIRRKPHAVAAWCVGCTSMMSISHFATSPKLHYWIEIL